MNVRKAMPLVVDLPSAGEDRPAWVKVGIIAAIGFVIGVAWPRLAGVRLGPSVPVEAAPSAVAGRADGPAATTGAPVAATAPSSAPAAAAIPPAAIAPTPPVEPPSLTVNRGVILSCKTEDGDSLKGVSGCGPVGGFDGIAQPRLRKLAACPAAMGASGKLSVVFNIDFPLNKVSVEIGKSSTVANVDGFGSCVRPAFQGVSLGALDHQNPRYSIFYSLIFGPKDGSSGASSAPASATSLPSPGSTLAPVTTGPATPPPTPMDDSNAQVVWEVAIVRDAPRTGQVLARLPRGTKVGLGAGQDGWFKVKYGSDLSSEGWLYRGAIGR